MHFLSKIISDVSETLDNNFFTPNTQRDISLIAERVSVEKLFTGVIHTSSGRFGSSTDTTLPFQFACDTSLCINFLFTIKIAVSIFNPCHYLLICTHIWTQNIRLRTNETFFGKLHRVFPCDSFNLSLWIFGRIKPNSTLGSTEWNICYCKFESHERGEGHSLLQRHIRRVPGSSFDWHKMMLMLSSVASKSLDDTVISLDRNLKSKNMVTSHDVFKHICLNTCFWCGFINE